MNNQKIISIVVPFFNEEEGVDLFYTEICLVFSHVPDLECEIVCIDDGSTDHTLDKLIAISMIDHRVHVVELSRNFGKEAALTAGIDISTGDAVIPIDADLQDPPELILELIKKWRDGYEVVLARRIDRSADSFLKRITAEMFYRVHNHLSSVKIPNNVGDFRLIDRVVVDAIKQLPEQQRFMKGLFAWVGFKTAIVDFEREPRAAGVAKFSGWALWNFAIEGITSFSTVPLKLWSYLGGVGAIFTLFYAVFVTVRTLLYGIDVPGYASLLVAILFFGSLQLISIGMLGEYIGRIYMETKNRPLYLIRKKYRNGK